MKFNPIYLLAAFLLVLSACGGEEGKGDEAEANPKSKISKTLSNVKTAIDENKGVTMNLAGDVDGIDAYGLGQVMNLPAEINEENIEVQDDGSALYTVDGNSYDLEKSGEDWLVKLSDEQIAAAIVYQFDKAMVNHNWDRAKELSNKKSQAAINMFKSNAEKEGSEKEDVEPIKDVSCEVKVVEEAKGDNPMGEMSEALEKAAEGDTTSEDGPKEVKVATCTGCCKKDGSTPKEYKVVHEKEGWRVEVSKGDK